MTATGTPPQKQQQRYALLKSIVQNAVVPLALTTGAGIVLDAIPHVSPRQLFWLVAFGGVLLYEIAQVMFAELKDLKRSRAELASKGDALERRQAEFIIEKAATRRALLQRAIGSPALASAIEEYQRLIDTALAESLARKSHPARKAALVVREQTGLRRAAEAQARRATSILEYYESLAPFLIEYRRELTEEKVADDERWRADYSDEEREDGATRFLTKDEYRRLSATQRNQLALDRYWARPHSPSEVGRMYERFVGYLYERRKYVVEYHGIIKGLEDLGRDLICRKGDEVSVIQCKNWSKHRTVHEKHLFQLYGSVFLYTRDNPGVRVHGAFYTSTSLSPVARDAAAFLNIPVKERMPVDKAYPCIKCNVSYRDRERIYHLPFDQQYDNVRIETERGELYCKTVAEAEAAGFRRAFRFHGVPSHAN